MVIRLNVYHSYYYRLKWTLLGPITILNFLHLHHQLNYTHFKWFSLMIFLRKDASINDITIKNILLFLII